MNNTDYYRTYEERLRDQLADGNIITIAGAGVSVSATKGNKLAQWHGLLEDGIDHCVANINGLSETWADRQKKALEEGDLEELISVARHIESKLGGTEGGKFYQWLKDTVGAFKILDESLPLSLLKLPTLLLTTNYDFILEKVSSKPAITWSNIHRVEDFFRGNEEGILHLHGLYSEPKDVVLGVNYNSLLGDEQRQAMLRSCLLRHRFLFVGVGEGLNDPHFDALMEWSKRIYGNSIYTHFLLTKRDNLAFFERAGNDHLVALPYGDQYEDLPHFLESLNPAPCTSVSTAANASTLEYRIVIDCDATTATQFDKAQVQATLRKLANDDQLELLRIEKGSLRLFLRSTENTRNKLEELSREGLIQEHLFGDKMDLNPILVAPIYRQIQTVFRSQSVSLINWPKTLKSGEWLARPELVELISKIEASESTSTIVVGSPGSGKSALLSSVAKSAIDNGWHVLAIKADLLSDNVISLSSLQQIWNLPLSIEDSIRYLCRKGKCLILVDQLDAVADMIDVKSNRLNVLLELINCLSDVPNLHILASARKFEFLHDVRLSSINAKEVTLKLPAWDQVLEVFKQHGVEASDWPESFREILRVPQHLKVMLGHFCEKDDPILFDSYNQMLEALWNKSISADPKRARFVEVIASDMAQAETLWVAKAKYDSEYHREIEGLIGEDVVRIDGNGLRLGFSHQTLFSFARARSFAKGSQQLSAYVFEGQDSLFIRPTLWSALYYIRAADLAQYDKQLLTMWSNKDLRQHVRFLLVDFLGQVTEPTDSEQQVIIDSLKVGQLNPRILSSLAGNEDWFKVLDALLPSLMTSQRNSTWSMVKFLVSALPYSSQRVLDLINMNWLPNPEYHASVWQILESLKSMWNGDAQQMIKSILRRSEVATYHVTHLVKELSHNYPEFALEIVLCKFEKDLEEAIDKVPVEFKRSNEAGSKEDEIVDRFMHQDFKPLEDLIEYNREWFELPDLANEHPKLFLKMLWPWFHKLLRLIVREENKRVVSYRRNWSLATALVHDDQMATVYLVPHAFDVAVKALAKNDANAFIRFVQKNVDSDVMLVQRLLARGLREVVSSHSRECVDFLLVDKRRLTLGNSYDIHQDTNELIRALVPYLDQSTFGELERYIMEFELYHKMEDELAAERRSLFRYNREHRLRLLNAIPAQYLTPERAAFVANEKNALKGYREWDSYSARMTHIDSPMSSDQMSKAKDKDIVGLFRKLGDKSEWEHPKRTMHGGTFQASRAFADFAKSEHKRAIAIISDLNPHENEIPVGQAVIALAESAYPPNDLDELIFKSWERGFKSESFREDAARAIRITMTERKAIPNKMRELLKEWLSQPWRRPVDVAENKPQGDVTDSADLYSLLWSTERLELIPNGTYHALDALTFEYLRQQPPLTEDWLTLLEQHLERQDRAEVWRVLTYQLDNLRLCDQPRASAFLKRLFDLYPRVLCSQNGVMLLAHARKWLHSPFFSNLLQELRDSDWQYGPQAFGELEFLHLGKKGSESKQFFADLTCPRDLSQKTIGIQTGLAHAASNLWGEPEYRANATTVLLSLLSCQDSDVLAAVLDVFRVTDQLTDDRYTVDLLDEMCKQRVFKHGGRPTFLVDHLVGLVTKEGSLVAKVVENLIDEGTEKLHDFSTAFFSAAPLLANIALTLQRYDGTRKEGLRIFEKLLELNAYGAQDALNDLDQIPMKFSTQRKTGRIPRAPRKSRSFE